MKRLTKKRGSSSKNLPNKAFIIPTPFSENAFNNVKKRYLLKEITNQKTIAS